MRRIEDIMDKSVHDEYKKISLYLLKKLKLIAKLTSKKGGSNFKEMSHFCCIIMALGKMFLEDVYKEFGLPKEERDVLINKTIALKSRDD